MCCFFGLFDPDDEEMYVEELVVGLLADESVNIAAMPDALERHISLHVPLLLFDLMEMTCNHMRMHMTGSRVGRLPDIRRCTLFSTICLLHGVGCDGDCVAHDTY